MEGSATTIAVLAGGAGSRIGGAKALQELAGSPLICRPLTAATATGLPVLVVAKHDSALPELNCSVLYEPPQPRHPLCGIVAALEHVSGAPVLAVACDMPFLTTELLLWFARRDQTAVACVDGVLQPLLALYRQDDLPALREALARQDSAAKALQTLRPQIVDELQLARFGDPRLMCSSVNDRAQLNAAERMIESAKTSAKIRPQAVLL